MYFEFYFVKLSLTIIIFIKAKKMARPLRIQYPGAQYHIISRGNGGQNIFQDDKDYLIFLEELKKVIDDYNWISFGYCLMPNHYHLFIKTLDPNLSVGMRQLNGNYTQRSNIRHGRYGHLFQGRFKSILVEDDKYHAELIRYIALNPVKAKLVKTLDQWKWSSHKEIMGTKKITGCVDIEEVLSFFNKNKKTGKEEYINYLKQKTNNQILKDDLRAGFILGSIEFAKDVINQYGNKQSKENVKKERFAGRPKLEKLFKEEFKNKKKRNELIFKAFKDYGYTQTEIGDYLGIHYSTISRIINNLRNSKNKTWPR